MVKCEITDEMMKKFRIKFNYSFQIELWSDE